MGLETIPFFSEKRTMEPLSMKPPLGRIILMNSSKNITCSWIYSCLNLFCVNNTILDLFNKFTRLKYCVAFFINWLGYNNLKFAINYSYSDFGVAIWIAHKSFTNQHIYFSSVRCPFWNTFPGPTTKSGFFVRIVVPWRVVSWRIVSSPSAITHTRWLGWTLTVRYKTSNNNAKLFTRFVVL